MSQMELEARLAEVTGKIDAIKELGGGLYAEAGRLERDGGDAKETRDFAQLVESSVDPRGLEALLDEQRILKQRLAQLRIDNSQA